MVDVKYCLFLLFDEIKKIYIFLAGLINAYLLKAIKRDLRTDSLSFSDVRAHKETKAFAL